MPALEDEWLWGWDPTPGIVSVWAEPDGRAWVWRRDGDLGCDEVRFRPWLVIAELADLAHLGSRLRDEAAPRESPGDVTYRELAGPGALRFLIRAAEQRTLTTAVTHGASRRLGRPVGHVRDLGDGEVLVLPAEEQYLVATGRTYFRDLAFDGLRRLQLDLETTGLDPARDRIFVIAVRDPDGVTHILEAADATVASEVELIKQLMALVAAADPDVIENHNLHGFDLPFLERRARLHGLPLVLGRPGPPRLASGSDLRTRAARRGAPAPNHPARRLRYTVPGRELIDTLDAVLRHDFSARDLPGHGLKVVARHMGLARDDREHIPGAEIYQVWQRDPARVRRYAGDDVHEVAGLARTLGGAAFALAGMAPRRYERLADAGAATGVIDPLLVRAYLRSGAALPAHEPGDGTPHSGAALHLFAAGVAHRVVKADVASLYPSLMREYRLGPARDRLGAMLAIVDRLVEHRLAAKARGRAAPPGSPERFSAEALSAAMKLVINSAYGYLGAAGLTRFSDVHAANRVTAHGRELLALMCRELAARGTTLLEADTDGVYFAVPAAWTEADERRVVGEVAAMLPARVQLEFEGRYAAMLSHEPKNYALAPYSGGLILRGVAFRSSRAEPFGEQFLRQALAPLLAGDVAGVQAVYLATVAALRRRALATRDVTAKVRLTQTPAQYLAARATRHQLPYEAMLSAGRTTWAVGERIRVYRGTRGRSCLYVEPDDADDAISDDAISNDAISDDDELELVEDAPAPGRTSDPRDYDVEHYLRVLRDHFAVRLARALTGEDYAAVFADPEQPSLFARDLSAARPILTPIEPDAPDDDHDVHP